MPELEKEGFYYERGGMAKVSARDASTSSGA